MSPHGAGMIGGTHSHDPQFPDDDWNLYAMLDVEGTTALNVTRPDQAVGVFKPFALRLNESPRILSDADEEIIVIARFTSPVHVRKIMIIGGGEEPSHHPSAVRCYVNQENIDFTNIASLEPAQEFVLPVNMEGMIELITVLQRFTNVMSLIFYFPMNHGSDCTIIKYVGMQGEHTHYRREAVNTTYEVLCNGQDIEHKDEALGAQHLH